MERRDVDYSLQKLKSTKHLTVDAYMHIAKLFEYVLYKLDEHDQPSVYGSYVDEPNYNDFGSEDTEKTQELEDIESLSESYIDDRNVPLVLATNAMLTPFRVDDVKHEEEGETERTEEVLKKEDAKQPEEDQEVQGGSRGTDNGGDGNRAHGWVSDVEPVKISTKPPKRLKFVGEEDKVKLHKDGLKRVKENLRTLKKKKSTKR